jgi:predicted protein tyrosine phosphatase
MTQNHGATDDADNTDLKYGPQMEYRHREILREQFGEAARDVRIEVLDIGDDFQFMDLCNLCHLRPAT